MNFRTAGLDTGEVYDVAANSWAAMPKQQSGPRIGPAVCSAGGLLFVIGGRDAEGQSKYTT